MSRLPPRGIVCDRAMKICNRAHLPARKSSDDRVAHAIFPCRRSRTLVAVDLGFIAPRMNDRMLGRIGNCRRWGSPTNCNIASLTWSRVTFLTNSTDALSKCPSRVATRFARRADTKIRMNNSCTVNLPSNFAGSASSFSSSFLM